MCLAHCHPPGINRYAWVSEVRGCSWQMQIVIHSSGVNGGDPYCLVQTQIGAQQASSQTANRSAIPALPIQTSRQVELLLSHLAGKVCKTLPRPCSSSRLERAAAGSFPSTKPVCLLAGGCSWVLTSVLKTFRSCFIIWVQPKYHCYKSQIGSTLLTLIQPDSFLACPLQWSSWPEGKGRAGFPPT